MRPDCRTIPTSCFSTPTVGVDPKAATPSRQPETLKRRARALCTTHYWKKSSGRRSHRVSWTTAEWLRRTCLTARSRAPPASAESEPESVFPYADRLSLVTDAFIPLPRWSADLQLFFSDRRSVIVSFSGADCDRVVRRVLSGGGQTASRPDRRGDRGPRRQRSRQRPAGAETDKNPAQPGRQATRATRVAQKTRSLSSFRKVSRRLRPGVLRRFGEKPASPCPRPLEKHFGSRCVASSCSTDGGGEQRDVLAAIRQAADRENAAAIQSSTSMPVDQKRQLVETLAGRSSTTSRRRRRRPPSGAASCRTVHEEALMTAGSNIV